MQKPRKKTKQLTVEHNPADSLPHSDESPRKEDFVGKFLLSVAIAFVTGLISQAISNQVNWLVVALAFVSSLAILALYQTRR
ncbi:MAG: hypothetical protein HY868_17565 [Chloroflexi bacterium]|nr:hypothetical protein [Chloroflexota bacterium]